MKRIMTFDGGGICGALTAALLQRLAALYPGLIERTNLFAGTSTGGIIALLLAAGIPVGRILALYRDDGAKIFERSWWDRVDTVGGLREALYHAEPIHGLLKELLGDLTMDQLRVDVLVPSFCVDNQLRTADRRWQARFWTRADRGVLVSDVAMMTSAAPTYFPAYNRNVDGGLVQNNPSMLAYSCSQDPGAILLSLGTSQTLHYIPTKDGDLGDIAWLRQGIISGFMQGAEDAADQMCRWTLGDRYRRLNPALQPGQDIAMDDYGDVGTLIDLGQTCDLLDVPAWLAQQAW